MDGEHTELERMMEWKWFLLPHNTRVFNDNDDDGQRNAGWLCAFDRRRQSVWKYVVCNELTLYTGREMWKEGNRSRTATGGDRGESARMDCREKDVLVERRRRGWLFGWMVLNDEDGYK